ETDFSDEMNFEVELVTGKVRVEIEKEILVSKKDESEHIKEFEAVLRSPIYEMGILISEILRQESKFCGADSEGLMRENTWSEIEKYNTGYDTIIYTVKDKLSNKEIMFAVRGCIQSVPS
ncbi:MAG: hypothetical protein U9Q06_01685, partial [Nanoarchaeota archaeon]|nr:hypothetical protein [Nanoarchaeota archaeon]